ncbi:AAA family ATPase [Bacillus mojavensis]|uniref:ATP-binding protein n=1 Tax=Bacillus mojavensis TaxID=72360 RepID=UPI0009DF7205|nr:AAA family ATPase [Bacillus mojavensis]MDR4226996.1 AAA family ATPase [Bacillus mojavensis]MEC3587656.1 AAA family ATPase [Bacillus mojavensis]MEC5244375.1 AAA family ATPase [Bacillus mojavensis]MED0750633.1 AAA family ATPase [Bacillus mojavensis]
MKAMRIISLHIYQYGKFSNRTFHFSASPVQLIYGLNEAGKTTMMSFIESMLFGFPKSKKYEPKSGGVYGGVLEAEHPAYGVMKIERTKGAAEKVRVYTESGEVKQEDFLKQLFQGTDRALYKAIYSFDVFGLQEIHTFNRDKIGEFLLFSSLFGAEAVSKLDSRLTKESERLFKPNGRNPHLNQELETLKQLAAKLKQAETEEAGYHQLLEEKRTLESRLAAAETELKETAEHIRRIERAIELKPVLIEKTTLEQAIEQYPEHAGQFPADGLHRLEKYESHLHPKSAQLEALRVKLAELDKQLQKLNPNEAILKNEALISELSSAYHMYQSYGEQLAAIQAQLRQSSSQAAAGLEQLNKTDENELLNMNTSYDYEWQLQQAVRHYVQARDRKRQLDEVFEVARRELEDAERAVRDISSVILENSQRKEKEAVLKAYDEAQGQHQEQMKLREQLKFFERQQAKQKKTVMAAGILFMVLFLLLKQWIPAICIGAALVLYAFTTGRKPLSSEEVRETKEPETDISPREAEAIREALWEDDRNKQHLISLRAELQQKEAAYERIIEQFEQWEADMAPSFSQAEKFMNELGFKEDPSFLLDAYNVMKDVQKEVKKKHELTIEAGRLQKLRRTFEERVRMLHPDKIDSQTPVADVLHELRKNAEREKEIEKQKNEINKDIQFHEEQVLELEQEIRYFQTQIEQLFTEAGAKDRNEFFAIADISKKWKDIDTKLYNVNAQLQGVSSAELNLADSGTLSELEQKRLQEHEKKERHDEELKQLRAQIALLLVKQEQLEASGLVSDLKLQTEMQKERVKESAKKWASIQMVRHVIKNKMERHKKVGLPRLLETAEKFFRPLTDGSYQSIYFSETDDSILVMNSAGTVFQAEELSQGTCEQLYTAIRFALAVTRQDGAMLPFQLDDSFVHFDQKRLNRVLEMLSVLSGGDRQIFYFTCHEHVKNAFQSDQITHLVS